MSTLGKLGLLAFLAAWLASGVADAEEPGAPGPMLEGRAYADYRYRPGPEWALEQASLGGGEAVSVDVDAWGTTSVELSLRGSPSAWSGRAARALRRLRTTAGGERVVRELEGFLARLDRASQLRGGSWTRYDLCRDGSLPTEDGCSLDAGGGFSAQVAWRSDGLQVVLTDEP